MSSYFWFVKIAYRHSLISWRYNFSTLLPCWSWYSFLCKHSLSIRSYNFSTLLSCWSRYFFLCMLCWTSSSFVSKKSCLLSFHCQSTESQTCKSWFLVSWTIKGSPLYSAVALIYFFHFCLHWVPRTIFKFHLNFAVDHARITFDERMQHTIIILIKLRHSTLNVLKQIIHSILV